MLNEIEGAYFTDFEILAQKKVSFFQTILN